MGGVGRGVGVGFGGQSGCERRIKVFVKIQKKKIFFLGGGGGGGRWGVGVGGQSGCERRIEGGGWVGGSGSCWGVRVDVNCEQRIEVFVKIQG